MATTTTDVAAVSRTATADGNQKPGSRRRHPHTDSGEEDKPNARYFLGKAGSDVGTPALEREVASEGEALVEALRLGVNYYAIEEFRVVPDFSGRRPQLTKESVQSR